MHEPIPQQIIDNIPSEVKANRDSCQDCLDSVKYLTQLVGYETPSQAIADSWTFTHFTKNDSLSYLNGLSDGRRSWLRWLKLTAEKYNVDLEFAPMEAERIRSHAEYYLRTAWERCNAIALAVSGEAGENVYRHLTI